MRPPTFGASTVSYLHTALGRTLLNARHFTPSPIGPLYLTLKIEIIFLYVSLTGAEVSTLSRI